MLSGIPSSPPYGNFDGSGPTASAGNLPITANFAGKNQKMNVRTIAIISLSAFVLVLVLLGAIPIYIKWRKAGKPSSAVGPAFTSSIHKRSGKSQELQASFFNCKIYVIDCRVVMLSFTILFAVVKIYLLNKQRGTRLFICFCISI